MMVGLKIVTIDDATHTVVFRYLEGTPSYGEQVMVFSRSADNPNVTEISHKTWYRAYGRVMETMYPTYHGMMIRGMHGRYRTIIEGDAGP
jgi:hypothetical protein